ncbi:MAG TPA: 30S ribosomal protein S6 [Thermoanaerobaculia bacterium]|nr:30S ribosomal protein S6 [Thermoanaerobaculia bacterium]
MRTYELMFITDARVADEEVESITEDVKTLLTAKGGQVLRVEQWGRRKLAYEIAKQREGKYTLLYLTGEPEELDVREVEYRMRQNDNILRFLTVRTDEDYKRAGMPLPTEAPPESESESESDDEDAAEAKTGGDEEE